MYNFYFIIKIKKYILKVIYYNFALYDFFINNKLEY